MISLEVSYTGRKIKVGGGVSFSNLYEKDVVNILRAQLVLASAQFLKLNQDTGFFPKSDYITLVDNKLNDDIRDVKAFGRIVYKTRLGSLKPVLLQAIKSIVERSPERTGAYLANHVLFKNNIFVAKGYSEIVSFIEKEGSNELGDVYRFVNVSPYARKLENLRVTKQVRGKYKGQHRESNIVKRKVKGKDTTIPAGAYVLSARSLKNKYKELKRNIRFTFLPIDPGLIRQLDTSGRDTTGYVFKGTKKSPGNQRPYLYPTLVISYEKSVIGFNRGFTERGA